MSRLHPLPLPHRSIWRLALPGRRIATALALAVLACAGLLAAAPTIDAAWQATLLFWMSALDLPGHFSARVPSQGPLLAGARLDAVLPAPGPLALALHALAAATAWAAGGRLPDAWRPGAYLLRFAALVQAASIVYFAGWAAWFPHTVASHADSLLQQFWLLMLVLPWLHALTYFLLPFAWWQHAALALLSLGWLALLAPCLVATHVALLTLAGPVLMPLLQLLLGTTLAVIGLVALYGWAMSWRPLAGADSA